jgi:hypothetical protein
LLGEFQARIDKADRTQPAGTAKWYYPGLAMLQVFSIQSSAIDRAAPANNFGTQFPVHVKRSSDVRRYFLVRKKTGAIETETGSVNSCCQCVVGADRAKRCDTTGLTVTGTS